MLKAPDHTACVVVCLLAHAAAFGLRLVCVKILFTCRERMSCTKLDVTFVASWVGGACFFSTNFLSAGRVVPPTITLSPAARAVERAARWRCRS